MDLWLRRNSPRSNPAAPTSPGTESGRRSKVGIRGTGVAVTAAGVGICAAATDRSLQPKILHTGKKVFQSPVDCVRRAKPNKQGKLEEIKKTRTQKEMPPLGNTVKAAGKATGKAVQKGVIATLKKAGRAVKKVATNNKVLTGVAVTAAGVGIYASATDQSFGDATKEIAHETIGVASDIAKEGVSVAGSIAGDVTKSMGGLAWDFLKNMFGGQGLIAILFIIIGIVLFVVIRMFL